MFQILHEKVYDEVLEKLIKAYAQVPIGDPTEGERIVDSQNHPS